MYDPRTRLTSFAILAAVSLILLITVLCYLPGLPGGFTFDDHPNITRNAAVQIDDLSPDALAAAALSYGDGFFKRPLSMLSIALNHAATGLDPLPYKITNLAIHLINGTLLFALVRLLLRAPLVAPNLGENTNRIDWIALVVSAAWLLHPLNVTSVLYVVQRMTSLSALFCLTGMLLYTLGRLRLDRGERSGMAMILTAVFVATPLAFVSKEIGILLPGYLFLIEWLLFGFATPCARDRWPLILLFTMVVGLPAIYIAVFLLNHPNWISGGYVNRPFSIAERALTEPRVLWLYLKLLVLPRPAALSLFHDDLPLSTGLTQPWTTLPALVGIVLLGIAALLVRKRWPLVAFGVLLFLGGHVLESGVLSLEIVHEHRNYLPGIGILLAITALILCRRSHASSWRFGAAVMVALIALFGATTAMRASVWSHPYRLALTGVTDHPQSSRWHHEMGWVLWVAGNNVEDPDEHAAIHANARTHLLTASALDPFTAPGALISVLHLDSTDNRPPDPQVVTELIARLPKGSVAPITVMTFSTLLECLSGPICSRPIPEINALITALLANPNLSGRSRGMLLSAAGQLAINQQATEQALEYAVAAIEADPTDLQYYLNYAFALLQAKRSDLAAPQLKHVKEHDIFDRFRAKRERLESLIPAD